MKHLRPGDILTHTYAHVRGRIPIVDESGKVRAVCAAKRANEESSSMPATAVEASCSGRRFRPLKQGFFPDVISTDLHSGSMNSGMKDILNTMSKFLNLGMPLADVIKANTRGPPR